MRLINSKIKKIVCALGVAVAMLGCGGAANNDQGVAFTLFGFFLVDQQLVLHPDTGVTGSIVALSYPGETLGQISDTFTALGVSNNLDGQTIRAERVYISYTIPGASTQPPSTSVPLTFVLGPKGNTGGSTLPGLDPAIGTTYYSTFSVLPAGINEWMVLNRDLIPEPPFLMEARVQVRGVTSSGTVIDTNELSYNLYVNTDLPIAPTDGSSDPVPTP